MSQTLNSRIPEISSSPSPHVGSLLQRKCACGQHTPCGGKCSGCEKKTHKLQRKAVNHTEASAAPPIVNDVLHSSGQPLDAGTRSFMESRFNHDFSRVRVHTDERAAKSAQAVNALAYTVGQNVVFAEGRYAAHTASGQRLLAHELTHVVQQQLGGGSAVQGKIHVGSSHNAFESEADHIADRIVNGDVHQPEHFTPVVTQMQRSCGQTEIGEPAGCEMSQGEVTGLRYLFRYNCDQFATGNEEDLRADALQIQPNEIVEIHGLASSDGDFDYNMNLSCARALKARQVIEEVLARRGVSATIRVFNHGEVEGDVTQQRSVVVSRTTPQPETPSATCGPDATDWFIRQVNAAKTDPVVLAIKTRLAGAERVARRFGFSAEAVAEGAVARKVLAEEARRGNPPRTTEASSQLTQSVPGQRAFARALIGAGVPIAGAPEAIVLAAIRGAALTWKGLVGTNRKYDFKNRPETLETPISENCPVNCANTITLCPNTASDCFVKDVPGNLFYAHVGRFVGWTELTLQLGSQFAQLESSSTWDPPEDTRMINFGFSLPDPLTPSGLCSAINANRSVFDLQECANCSDEIDAAVV